MKNLCFVILLLSYSFIAFAQTGNVGIGTAAPGTRLDVAGALTLRQDTVVVLSNAGTILSNSGQVSLQGSASGTMTITAPIPQNAGQQLTVFNNVGGGQVAKMNGYSIPNGQSLTFRSNGTTAASFLPDANNFVNVRVIPAGSFSMLTTDYFIKFTATASYLLVDAALNTGRVVYFYAAGPSTFPSIFASGSSPIVNAGSTTTTTALSLTPGNRVMLISDGVNWVIM